MKSILLLLIITFRFISIAQINSAKEKSNSIKEVDNSFIADDSLKRIQTLLDTLNSRKNRINNSIQKYYTFEGKNLKIEKRTFETYNALRNCEIYFLESDFYEKHKSSDGYFKLGGIEINLKPWGLKDYDDVYFGLNFGNQTFVKLDYSHFNHGKGVFEPIKEGDNIIVSSTIYWYPNELIDAKAALGKRTKEGYIKERNVFFEKTKKQISSNPSYHLLEESEKKMWLTNLTNLDDDYFQIHDDSLTVSKEINRLELVKSDYITYLKNNKVTEENGKFLGTPSQTTISSSSSQNTQESNIPTTEELTQKLEIINDNYEEIKYLNSVIHAIILSPLKSNYGTLYSLCYFHKLNIELPQLYDDPSITLSEWQENLNFIELLGNDFCASKKDNSQMELRGLYLYYKVCLKQKINGHPDVNDLKLITSEFNQNNFPIKGSFFNSCKEVLEQANNNYSSNTNSGNSNNTPSKPKITKEEFKKHVIYDNTSTTECVLCNRTVYCTKRPQSELNQEIDINYNLVIENNFRLNIFENMSKGIKDNDATFVKTYKCDSHCADCKKKYGFTH
jgi:hypothetical protein